MQEFTKKMGFIVGFLICTLIVNLTLGNDATFKFLGMVLLSMLILNAEQITSWVRTNFV